MYICNLKVIVTKIIYQVLLSQRVVLFVRAQVYDKATVHSSNSLTTIGQTGYILRNEARRTPGSTREKSAAIELSVEVKRYSTSSNFIFCPNLQSNLKLQSFPSNTTYQILSVFSNPINRDIHGGFSLSHSSGSCGALSSKGALSLGQLCDVEQSESKM